jgi:hypothetical protein
MKYHPAQSNPEAIRKIVEAFHKAMEKRKLLPKNPWRAKRTEAWLAKMGARMQPGDMGMSPWKRLENDKFFNFRIECPPSKTRIRGRRGHRFMRIEIPHELADRILVLGYLP